MSERNSFIITHQLWIKFRYTWFVFCTQTNKTAWLLFHIWPFCNSIFLSRRKVTHTTYNIERTEMGMPALVSMLYRTFVIKLVISTNFHSYYRALILHKDHIPMVSNVIVHSLFCRKLINGFVGPLLYVDSNYCVSFENYTATGILNLYTDIRSTIFWCQIN